jgi:hypothetical protein
MKRFIDLTSKMLLLLSKRTLFSTARTVVPLVVRY